MIKRERPWLLLSLSMSLMSIACFIPYEVMIQDKPIVLESDWKSIEAKSLLRPKKRFQYVVLEVDDKTDLGEDGGIYLPDRRLAKPQVELIDSEGGLHRLGEREIAKGRSGTFVRFTAPNLGQKKYRGIRVRSDVPVSARSIRWYCQNPLK